MERAEVLLIGGRAGAGMTTVGREVSVRPRAAGVSHAIIEGDFMGQVHPAPEGNPHRSKITERDLTTVWANFAEARLPPPDLYRHRQCAARGDVHGPVRLRWWPPPAGSVSIRTRGASSFPR
jgi:hypothetical protein